jgi:hypothetical protein
MTTGAETICKPQSRGARALKRRLFKEREMKNFSMANSENPEDVSRATRDAIVSAMRDVLLGMKEDLSQPGLTWAQLEYFLDEFQKKEPIIITQSDEI